MKIPGISVLKETFKDLTFDEATHKYFVNGEPLSTSVSGVIKQFVEKTDFKLIASNIDIRDGLPKGTTSKIWNYNSRLACAKGDKAHYFGEIYAFHRKIKPTDPYEKAIVKFWNDLPDHIIPVKMELEMYHKTLLIGGMADIILYNKKTGNYIIADYKTNKQLFKNFKGKMLLPPFDNMLEHNFNKYQLQFSFYQIMFEQTGFKVEARKLIHLKPTGEYEIHDTEDLTNKIRKELWW